MKEQSTESTLRQVTAPAPDPQARLRAKRAALAEFARVHAANNAASATPSKGFWNALRLSGDDSSHGRTSMTWFVSRKLIAGVASVCVVGLGIAMVWPFFSRYGDERLMESTRTPITVELPPPPPPLEPVTAVQPQPGTPAPKLTAAKEKLRRNDADAKKDESNEIVVTGRRAVLQPSLEVKREAPSVVDAIRAEDVAEFPGQHQNAASSRQKVAGLAASTGAVMVFPAPEMEQRDKFQQFDINPLKRVADEPVSTFSADVDTASYSLCAAHVERRHAAAERRGTRRGDDQLLRLRLAKA